MSVRAEANINSEIDDIRASAAGAARELTLEERARLQDLVVERAAAQRMEDAQRRHTHIREARDYWRPHERAKLRTALRPSIAFVSVLGVAVGSGVMLAMVPSERSAKPLAMLFVLSAWIVSVCVHEFGHAIVAYFGGDRSVIAKGYLNLDPRKYTNPLLSIILPIAFLLMGGIALPGGSVWIDRSALRSRRWELGVSAAGPAGTLLCLLIVSIPFAIGTEYWVTDSNIYFASALAGLAWMLGINLLLNLLPIPPLDGFRILSYWLPYETTQRAFALGWMPLLLLYMALRAGSPLASAFWSTGNSIAAILNIPLDYAMYGIYLLRLG